MANLTAQPRPQPATSPAASSASQSQSPTSPAADGVALGLAVVAAATVGVLVLAGDLLPPVVAVVVVVSLLAVATARRRSRALRWTAAVVAVAFLAMNAPFAIEDLQHPESGLMFVAVLAAVVGSAATAGLAVASALGRAVPVRRVWVATGVVLAAGATLAVVTSAGVPVDTIQPGDVEVLATGTAFPERVSLPPDAGAVVIRNDDAFRHTFEIASLVGPVELPAGATVRIPLDLPAGEYAFTCDVVGHEGMAGTLTIE